MIKVYFESSSYSELVAVFDSEEMYMACAPALEQTAKAGGMIVTESISENHINEACFPDSESISIFWSIEDIKDRAKQTEVELTDDQAKEVLSLMDSKHDANIGINWEVIDEWIYYVLEN